MLWDRGALYKRTRYAVELQGYLSCYFKAYIPSTLPRNGRTYDPAIQVVLTWRDVRLCLTVF